MTESVSKLVQHLLTESKAKAHSAPQADVDALTAQLDVNLPQTVRALYQVTNGFQLAKLGWRVLSPQAVTTTWLPVLMLPE